MLQLELKGISQSYFQNGERIPVLKDLNLSVNYKETVALVGESGSGKSTLLSLLCGLDLPESGDLFIQTKRLTGFSQTQWTDFRGKNIGIVFQQFHLVSHLTALENVLLPLQIHKIQNAEKKAKILLDQVGLSHRVTHMPSQLSGGECQRVALARAFSMSPSVLLADEPSGNLDSRTGAQVIDLMFSLIAEHSMTALIVTHSQELARRCQTQYRLAQGALEKITS